MFDKLDMTDKSASVAVSVPDASDVGAVRHKKFNGTEKDSNTPFPSSGYMTKEGYWKKRR